MRRSFIAARKNLSTSSLIGTINVPDLEPVDLSGHGTKGPEFSLSSFNNKGFDFHTLSDMGRFDHFAPIIVEEISLDLGVVRRLEKGDIIDSQRAFVNDSPTSVRLIDNNPNGQWTGGTDDTSATASTRWAFRLYMVGGA